MMNSSCAVILDPLVKTVLTQLSWMNSISSSRGVALMMFHLMGHKVLQRHNSPNMMIHKKVKTSMKNLRYYRSVHYPLIKSKKPILFYALVNLSILSKFENSGKTLMFHSMDIRKAHSLCPIEWDIRNAAS